MNEAPERRSRRPGAAGLALLAGVVLVATGAGLVAAESARVERRAAGPLAVAGSDGASCQASSALEDRAAHRAALAEALATRLEAELGAEGGEARTLNGRGYGYRAQRSVMLELQHVEAEAALQQRRR